MLGDLWNQKLRKLLAALLLVTGVAAVEGVCAELHPQPLAGMLLSYGVLMPALAITYWAGRRFKHGSSVTAGQRTLPPVAFGCLVGLLLLPLPTNWFGERLFDHGLPLEVLLLAGLRNLALGLIALPGWRSALRCALAAAACMVLFAATMALGDWVRWPLLVFGLLACLWLLLGYWTRLEGADAARRFPVGIAAGLLLLLATELAVVTVGPERIATALGAWLPASGGDEGYAKDARGGLGDGDEVVKARQAPRSVGISESDLMLETEQPSLYDLVGQQYGPPMKRRDQDQAQTLDGEKRKQDFTAVENLKVSREFPLHRQAPPAREMEATLADALLYVQGRVPQHLRLEAHYTFDGQAWLPSDPPPIALQLRKQGQSNWFEIEGVREAPTDAGTERLAVKIAKLGGNILPLPGGVERFRLGKLSRPDFFGWGHEGLLRLVDRNLPSGIAVEAEVRTTDWQRANGTEFPIGGAAHQIYRRLPADWPLAERLAELARAWSAGLPPGPTQIEAILARLRSEYTLDRAYRPPPDCADALEDFLFVSRRGPDYQFASAAALLLRTLDYPTRLVAGFYANPERYDTVTGHTFIQRDDVHTWLEVLGPGNRWLTLEPTPGYRVAGPAYSWLQKVWHLVSSGFYWIAARPLFSLATLLLAGLAYGMRHRVFDAVATWTWRSAAGPDWRGRTLATLKLLERRARWAGLPRPPGQTPARWYPPLADDNLQGWATLTDAALYAPAQSSPPCADGEVALACQSAADQLTLARLRRLATQRGRQTRDPE